MVAIAVRRYECQSCGAVMTVVPAGMLAHRQYSASSIALALYLWLVLGLSDRQARRRISAWQVQGRSSRGWAQLYRWTRSAASLFGLPRATSSADTAVRALTTLRALAPAELSAAPITIHILAGAARTQ